jgi:hypothetical protein
MSRESRTPAAGYVVGLDLAQVQDYTGLAVVERIWRPDPAHPGPVLGHYAVRFLRRWPVGTPYTTVLPEVVDLVSRPPLKGCLLAVDHTGVGEAVVDLLCKARPSAVLRPMLVTAGYAVTWEAGVWHVPRKELVGCLQVLLQTRRLRVADLPERAALAEGLQAFRAKITAAGDDSLDSWRERDHDDLVLAVGLACWLGEQVGPPECSAPVFVIPQAIDRMSRPSAAARRGLFGLRP